jgi:hypothetical protein
MAGGLLLFCGSSQAQQGNVFNYRWDSAPTIKDIGPADIRNALVWTGHFEGVYKGELNDAVRKATQAWQKSKGHPVTESLPDDQIIELVAQGLKERDEVGWSLLVDKTVGIAVGVPANLVTFGTPRNEEGALWYNGGGAIAVSIGVHMGYPSCRSMDGLFLGLPPKPLYRSRLDDGFVVRYRNGERESALRWLCHHSGSVSVEMNTSVDTLEAHRGLFAAMALHVALLRTPDPTLPPRMKIEDLPVARSGFDDEGPTKPEAKVRSKTKTKPTATAAVDGSGKSEALKIEVPEGPELRADEIFDRAAAAIYKVKADKMQGSAVAISESELLTNCHVVTDLPEVTIVHDKQENTAKVVSRNADADRCVLRVDFKLPKWVAARPYDDIKVGERAITIGTPYGLDLTVAEGIVSSKRRFNRERVIQTSAPVSPGSSGGALFDARGHLLGITTFQFKGQNLNFAIAAEEYAQQPEESSAAR